MRIVGTLHDQAGVPATDHRLPVDLARIWHGVADRFV
jgi:hypothetical protein